MVYILEKGDKKKAEEVRAQSRIFFCHLCGCRWKATRHDYTRDWDFRTGNYILSGVCPCCNEVIRMEEPE